MLLTNLVKSTINLQPSLLLTHIEHLGQVKCSPRMQEKTAEINCSVGGPSSAVTAEMLNATPRTTESRYSPRRQCLRISNAYHLQRKGSRV